MMKNDKPYSIENGWEDALLVTDLPVMAQALIFDWITLNLWPGDKINHQISSYGSKHIFERDTGIYITNNQFKDAMLEMGFIPVNPDELNWYYQLDRKSPALKRSSNENYRGYYHFMAFTRKLYNDKTGDYAGYIPEDVRAITLQQNQQTEEPETHGQEDTQIE